MTAIHLLMVSLFFKGCFAACTMNSTYIWPLGGGIGLTEIKNNSASGTIGSVLYGTGLAAVGNYSVMEFNGTNDSYVNVNVPFPITASTGDYSVMFFMKIKNASLSSTVLHYRSNNFQAGSTSEIGEFIISVVNESIVVNFTNFGSGIWDISLLNLTGNWYHVVYSRDVSKYTVKLFLNGTSQPDRLINLTMAFKNTSSPGVLRVGGNMDGSNSLSGAVTCLQIVSCKDAVDPDIYGPKCSPNNWPSTTTSSAPTTSSSAPTTSSSAPKTSSSAPTTTSSAPTTSSSAPTTTSSAPTTSSIAPTTTTSAPTTTGASMTTTMLPTTTTPNSGNLDFAVITGCNHYRMTGSDLTFGNYSDIIDVLMVSDTAKCSLECDRCAECYMFAVASQVVDFECKLGVKTTTLMNQTGSRIFEN